MATLPDVPQMARNALFISVGLGLLGVNQLQVRRRELAADLRRLAAAGPLSTVLGGTANQPPAGEPGQGPGATR